MIIKFLGDKITVDVGGAISIVLEEVGQKDMLPEEIT
jgi:hypothetical protein